MNDVWLGSTAKRVIRGILRVDGSLRPTVAQVTQHEWVCGKAGQIREQVGIFVFVLGEVWVFF